MIPSPLIQTYGHLLRLKEPGPLQKKAISKLEHLSSEAESTLSEVLNGEAPSATSLYSLNQELENPKKRRIKALLTKNYTSALIKFRPPLPGLIFDRIPQELKLSIANWLSRVDRSCFDGISQKLQLSIANWFSLVDEIVDGIPQELELSTANWFCLVDENVDMRCLDLFIRKMELISRHLKPEFYANTINLNRIPIHLLSRYEVDSLSIAPYLTHLDLSTVYGLAVTNLLAAAKNVTSLVLDPQHLDKIQNQERVQVLVLRCGELLDTSLANFRNIKALQIDLCVNFKFKYISNLTTLEAFSIRGCFQIMGSIAHITSLKNLQYLKIVECPHIQNSDFAGLCHLAGLKALDLRSNFQITDEIVPYLAPCKALKHIELRGTNITKKGIAPIKFISTY